MIAKTWNQEFNWDTPAGRLLRQLAAALPKDRPFEITVFGSAPLQIMLDPTFLSGDVDVFCELETIASWVKTAQLDDEKIRPHLQICTELAFRSSPLWVKRAKRIAVGKCTFLFPHPIDILLGKLNRLEQKDLEAFQLVRAKTGHPTEAELIAELQIAVDLFRPAFADEENAGDYTGNVRRLWPILYGREMDPRKEIILPALAKRQEGFGEPTRDYKRELLP